MSRAEVQYDDLTLVQKLKNNLKSEGNLGVIGLRLNNRFFSEDFISRCIDEIDKFSIRLALDDKVNDLERLAFYLLCDSAYIDLQEEQQKEFLKRRAA